MAQGTKKAVIFAILANATVTLIKFAAALFSASAAMMNEAIHSLMDTANQLFLFFGLRESRRPADKRYAFGHAQKKYLWNLWSAIGLFSIGAGLGLAHAWHAWQGLEDLKETNKEILWFNVSFDPVWINLIVLIIAFLLEGFVFVVALKEFLHKKKEAGYTSNLAYLKESEDPTLLAVLFEDTAAMIGLLFAALGIGLTSLTGHAEYDVLFSALIALMLGVIAFYLGTINMKYLADMRDNKAESVFREVIAEHPEIEGYHDLRSIILDENTTILVAEIELREEALVSMVYQEISKKYHTDLDDPHREQYKPGESLNDANARALVETTIARTEQIIDEIERDIKTRLPRVDHITLEVEGVS